jgi:hypothetical protein
MNNIYKNTTTPTSAFHLSLASATSVVCPLHHSLALHPPLINPLWMSFMRFLLQEVTGEVNHLIKLIQSPLLIGSCANYVPRKVIWLIDVIKGLISLLSLLHLVLF